MFRVFTDARCLLHPAPPGFPERPERLAAILQTLRRLATFEVVEPPEHPEAEALVRSVHAPEYVDRFRRAAARGDGLLDTADNPVGPATFEAAMGAVSASLHAADAAADGARATLAAIRPPGHHAERSRAMGFCYFGNAALAAEQLRRRGASRVAVLDFDVHHGNGTQHLFEERSDVLYASVHQYPFYPGTGAASERGKGAGLGFTLNVPLAAGSGDEEYGRAFGELLIPALEEFRPDAVVVSAGFDAYRADPLGGMRVRREGFQDWGRMLGAFGHSAGIPLVSILEGGYHLDDLPALVEYYLVGLYAEIT